MNINKVSGTTGIRNVSWLRCLPVAVLTALSAALDTAPIVQAGEPVTGCTVEERTSFVVGSLVPTLTPTALEDHELY